MSWSCPTEVSHYIVEMRNIEDSHNKWKTGAEHETNLTCVIEKLALGDEYYFRVIAVNDDLKSEPSPISEKVLVEGKLY